MWVCPYGLRCVLPQPALCFAFKVAAFISLVCCARALGLVFGIWAFGFGRLGVFQIIGLSRLSFQFRQFVFMFKVCVWKTIFVFEGGVGSSCSLCLLIITDSSAWSA